MKPLIIGNWKMNKTVDEAMDYINEAVEPLTGLGGVDVVLCVPFTVLPALSEKLQDQRLHLGAQNVAEWQSGAHTGEISATMLAPLCDYVIVGHSERRKMGETVEQVNEKIARAIEAGLQPVVCISNKAELDALATIKGITADWIVAFEPLEAIGSGKAEDPEVVKQMYDLIKEIMGQQTRAIYGGSVTAENIGDYVPLCDGALPGGASLDPQGFLALCQQINH